MEDFKRKAPMGLVIGLFMAIGREAISGYEISDKDGFDAAKFSETINKWIDGNPEKTKQIVDEACALVLDASLIV